MKSNSLLNMFRTNDTMNNDRVSFDIHPYTRVYTQYSYINTNKANPIQSNPKVYCTLDSQYNSLKFGKKIPREEQQEIRIEPFTMQMHCINVTMQKSTECSSTARIFSFINKDKTNESILSLKL